MKKTMLAIVAVAALLSPSAGLARGPMDRRGHGGWAARCSSVEDLGFSPEQKKAVERAEQAFGGSIRALRNQWTSRRLELRELLADPAAGDEVIRAKGRELTAAQSDLQRAILEYRLRVRAVLGPDQLSRWCRGPTGFRGGGSDSCVEP